MAGPDVYGSPADQSGIKLFCEPTTWQAWEKPRGCRVVEIFCLGAGGGGGNGCAVAAATAGSGGGGGGSGALVRASFSAAVLPDVLYIRVGLGGGATQAGGRSYVSAVPAATPAAANLFLVSGAADAGAGGTGTTSTAAGGAAGTVMAATTAILSNLGRWVALAGQAGGNGGLGAQGTTIIALNALPVGGGAGGGGPSAANANFTGGQITGTGLVPTRVAGQISGTAGDHGVTLWPPTFPFMSCGGAGAGSSATTANTFIAGNGGVGSGGGGGGGGTAGGAGGRGGDGLVIITAW